MIFQICPFLFVVLTNLCSNTQVYASPVLLWANVNLPRSTVSLSTLSSLDFISNYVCQIATEEIQLRIFTVNDLTIEGVQQGLQSDYPLLLDVKKAETNFRYYPNVADDIYQTFLLLQSNTKQCPSKSFQLKSSENFDKLDDALHKMEEKIADVGTDTSSTVLFAIINHPVDNRRLYRQRRQTTTNASFVLISNNNTCMFYAKQLHWNDVNGSLSGARVYKLNITDSSCESTISPIGNRSSVVLKLIWTNDQIPSDIVNMSLTTTIIGLYWTLENATINGEEYRYFAYGMHSQMETPPTYSYVCTTATFVRYNALYDKYGQYNFSKKFYITNLQFQPFNSSQLTFGLPNYCTSFFTRGIWMAITSSLLCLGILLFAIYHLMAIKSNDRFDDPKGKPLFIKTQE
ncbi:unnamed protein product [Rotaria magnacalcarata]|uniref:V-type proton ATPase subunit S1/VOA1 transmembrane domain-containing protein n=1 Tax=Rotaria magnacalcarata TaxID=392030 RepID=A0A815B0V6_9BILA|nr:unnamed protein product [Rotaria magnacalcarata]CAF1430636.1 unnamed protein product [Rotaria magnacalcarata]CAF2080743.1 unnamed protein product [Rotaria magnacalcarata]CAF3771066.1 unnamed protein product [Rotaria magnacalcarata]CAF3787322.1 unnamed protein product [Rotaria magnacalcarata]